MTHNKCMQPDQSARYARTLAADAGRYMAGFYCGSMRKVYIEEIGSDQIRMHYHRHPTDTIGGHTLNPICL